jgi:hypothetical protein
MSRWAFREVGNYQEIILISEFPPQLRLAGEHLLPLKESVIVQVRKYLSDFRSICYGLLEIVRNEATRKMRVGPSESACRSGLQTTLASNHLKLLW